jgi:hypothetical protein
MMVADPAYLVFDIETVADGRLIQRIRYPEEPELTPAVAVARYRERLRGETGSDFIPHTFQVPVAVAIAKVASDHRLIEVVTLDRPRFRPQVIARQFWRGWEHYGRPSLVTFNGRGFDLAVLELAAYRYGLPIPAWFRQGAKSWEDPRNRYSSPCHIDLLDVVSNFGAARVSGGLDLLATLLGKPGKMETKGEMVQDLWTAGEHQRIDDYCMCDCLDTYFVFLRIRLLQGAIDLAQERACVDAAREWIARAAADNLALAAYLARFSHWQPSGDDDDPFVGPATAAGSTGQER